MKQYWRDLPLRKALVLYVAAAVVLALALCAATFDLCDSAVIRVRASYPISMEKYYLTNARGEQLGDGTYIGSDPVPLAPRDQWIVHILQVLPVAMAPVYSASCILAAALLFYRDKLKRPLAELRLASEKISNNDLDFTISFKNRDELGQLCASFETMRAALSRNFSEMWRQMEERKRLNAAFAHDLRTPLTVLKGYNEILQISEEPKTQAAAFAMQRHISRLEHYVDTMSRLHRLEDTQPDCQRTALDSLAASLCESAEILCRQAGKRFSLQDRTVSQDRLLDAVFISQVHSNLIANAARYAAASVVLSLEETEAGLRLSVSDDGPGFDKVSQKKAANPYFTREKADHFGLGLYICNILCVHHGGWLRIENTPSGACVTAFFKSIEK